MDALQSLRPEWNGNQGGASLSWSWLGYTQTPLRSLLEDGAGFGIYLTVLPPGAKPPATRPMIGSHSLSRVLQGDVGQIKANSQRITTSSRHSPDTSPWHT